MGFFDIDLHDLAAGLPSREEFFKAIFDLSLPEVAMLIGIALWFVILALSLKNIDRRDSAAGATYVLFMMTAGVVLTMALPARIQGSYELSSRQVVILIAQGLIAAWRWSWRRVPEPTVSSELASALEEEEKEKAA